MHKLTRAVCIYLRILYWALYTFLECTRAEQTRYSPCPMEGMTIKPSQKNIIARYVQWSGGHALAGGVGKSSL